MGVSCGLSHPIPSLLGADGEPLLGFITTEGLPPAVGM